MIDPMTATELDLAALPRWRGQPHRLEVHYLTATDSATGTGLWLHHEVVAPPDDDAYGHGWIATFPRDGIASYTRFGPSPATPLNDGTLFRSPDALLTTTTACGRAGDVEWDLRWPATTAPLWTFSRWAWRRSVLPAAQVVPIPTTQVSGTVGSKPYDGVGGLAHIDGHGNAQRWVWLHAQLGGEDVLEVVAATARRPGMRALPPLPLLQLRVDGRDWPADPLATAPLFRARIDEDGFRIRGIAGRHRLDVTVTMPSGRWVDVGYTDPDGATATCRNSEAADATVRLDRLTTRGWETERSWALDGTAHAEIGTRP
jgi:hypothetical protein